MPPSLLPFRLNRLCTSEPAPWPGPSLDLKYQLKYFWHISLYMLSESNRKGIDSSMILIFSLGYLATAHFIILKWVCTDISAILSPISIWSSGGWIDPIDSSTLIKLEIKGSFCFMRSLMLCLYNSSMINLGSNDPSIPLTWQPNRPLFPIKDLPPEG